MRPVLLLAWLGTVAAAWWVAPQPAGRAEARADIAAGRVTAYQWADLHETEVDGPWTRLRLFSDSGTAGPLFVWRTPDLRMHVADAENYDQVNLTGTVDATRYAGEGTTGIAQDLLAAGVRAQPGRLDTLDRVSYRAGVAVAFAALVLLIVGPAPALGTRWFWGWMILLVPYGLGMVFWLFRDRPWATVERPAVLRDRGWLGLVLALLLATLINVGLLV